jgi:hypothetical protein
MCNTTDTTRPYKVCLSVVFCKEIDQLACCAARCGRRQELSFAERTTCRTTRQLSRYLRNYLDRVYRYIVVNS